MKLQSCFCAGLLILPVFLFAQPVAEQVSMDYVIKKAQERAAKPFHLPQADLPEEFRENKLNYDSYREIEFRHDKALWTKEELPFRLEFFHRGYLYTEPVKIHEFNATHVQHIRFVQDFFEYRKLNFPKKLSADTEYAGFKLLCRLNDTNRWDELGSFLGKTYFRLLGKDQRYGQSARALALNSGESDRAEEFPAFTDWWLGKPEKQSDHLRFYGLLDGPSCSGAYEFLVRPGETTTVDINAVVFWREEKNITGTNRAPVKTFGLAPLTSMFWFGENSENKPDDYRPEVHDSDGLIIQLENGESLWRPLNNPNTLQHQVFPAKNIRGFGLLQRDREIANYQDIFNYYHKVSSVWIEPHGKWDEGEVHLVELPTKFEGLDNIVAFWNPKGRPQPMQPFRFGYRLHWSMEADSTISSNKVLQTRVGAVPHDASKRQVVIDFAEKNDGSARRPVPQANVSCSENAEIFDTQVFPNIVSESWRVIFSLKPKAGNKNPVDIQCRLKRGEQNISETWIYRWHPVLNRNAPD